MKQDAVARRIIEGCIEKNIDAEKYDLRLSLQRKNDVQDQLLSAIRKYDAVVVIWSKQYARDEWLQDEFFAIQMVQRERENKFIYTAIADKEPVPAILHRLSPVLIRDRMDAGVNEIVQSIPHNRNMFVVMKFGDDDLNSAYETIIRPTAESFGYDVLRIDERQHSNSINYDILKKIEGAGLVLCDLTGERPNVYFETGYALALGKEIILTARENTVRHFDLIDRNTIIWKTPKQLQEGLRARFESIAAARTGALTP